MFMLPVLRPRRLATTLSLVGLLPLRGQGAGTNEVTASRRVSTPNIRHAGNRDSLLTAHSCQQGVPHSPHLATVPPESPAHASFPSRSTSPRITHH